jgi:hypothetical protein
LELTDGRPELADLDGVARDAGAEARLTELVDLAILAKAAFIEERNAVAADACLAARAAQPAIVSAELLRVVALRHA